MFAEELAGAAVRQGPITLQIPLPTGPFLSALPAEQFLVIGQEEEEEDEDSEETVVESAPPPEKENPLQAKPATWDSPELDARPVDPNDDPLNLRRENRVKHSEDPLNAKPTNNSEDVLKVKDY